MCIATITRRRSRGKKLVEIRGTEDAERVLKRHLKGQKRKLLLVILLNASIVHPREVFKPAVVNSAASIILAHNHPSGDPEPSQEDLDITKRLVQVRAIHGIAVFDDMIVADRGLVSPKSRDLLCRPSAPRLHPSRGFLLIEAAAAFPGPSPPRLEMIEESQPVRRCCNLTSIQLFHRAHLRRIRHQPQ